MRFVYPLMLVFLVSFASRATPATVVLSDSVVAQGAMVRLDIIGPELPDTVTGEFNGKPLPFIRRAVGGFYTLIGVDMEAKPGRYPIEVDLGARQVRLGLRVMDANFPVQRLTLPPSQVFPDSRAQARIEREDGLRNERWSRWETVRHWEGTFIRPLDGEMKRFGHRRIINDTPRSPHTGVDISAETGTPVLAPAGGRVILTGDFFFTGKSIYIDHGHGLISMYFHLSRVDAADGNIVVRGQVIGAVGATGRVTGPHLHWGVRYRGTRINPESLLNLELD